MFNRRRLPFASKVLAGLSLTCGVVAFVSVRVMEARLVTLHPSVGPPVSVVVAAVDSRRGSVIDTAMIKVEPIPSTFAPPGALQGIQDAVGRVLLSDVATGEILTQTRLASRSGGPIAALVPSGLRAVVVIVGGSAQDLRPGDRVDVLAAFGGDSPHTEIAGHDLELLRAANGGEGAGAGAGSQTGVFGGSSGSQAQASLLLLVDPTEAERLAYAQAFASLSIAVEPALGSR